MIQQRQYNIDLLRILACFMVVFLHVSSSGWYTIPVSSFEWKVFNLYDTAVRSCVPLFFMISGMLFLSKESCSLKKLFLKNIAKLVFVYFLWSCIYAVDTLGPHTVIHDFDWDRLVSVVLASKYHLWYLPALVSVYLILPILHAVKGVEDGKILVYAVGFFLLFGIVQTSISFFPTFQNISIILEKFDYAFASFCGYFILGYVIHKKIGLLRVRSVFLLLLFIITVLSTAVGSYLISVEKGAPTASLYNYLFISTFIEACVIFVIFLRIPADKFSEKAGKIIQKISKYTLFVYLFHPFVLEHLDKDLNLNTFSMNAVISVPLISLVVFSVCLLAAFIIEKIPYVNKALL